MISQHYFTFPLYLPRVFRTFRNWPEYLQNYLCRNHKPASYALRNGWRLVDEAGTLAGTIAVVFLRREYGTPKDARTIVDVGGNMGCFALFAAQEAPNAKILCFEPGSRNFEILSRNIASNQLQGRIIAQRAAVGGQGGVRELSVGESPLNSLVIQSVGQSKEVVPCITLEELMTKHSLTEIDFLKLNCEGAEYEILEGCNDATLRRIRVIRLEYHNLDSSAKNGCHLAAVLEKHGFAITRFSNYRERSGFIWATNRKANPAK